MQIVVSRNASTEDSVECDVLRSPSSDPDCGLLDGVQCLAEHACLPSMITKINLESYKKDLLDRL